MKKMGKKGLLGLHDIPSVIFVLVLVGIISAVGLLVLASISNNATIGGNVKANAAIQSAITAVSEIPSNWLLIFAVIVAASIVLGIVIANFSFNQERK